MNKITRRTLVKTGSLAVLSAVVPVPLATFVKRKKMEENQQVEVIIIGGSYAGLSAAMALGRSMRTILIIDGGDSCNKQTPHSHNFITQDGEKPAVIAQKAREQVLAYPTVSYLSDFVVYAHKTENGFEVKTRSGRAVAAKKLIFATGIKDKLPEINGFSACWGISVIHCPYCHGYEYRGKQTAIMANGERAFHVASLVNNLTEHLTILTSGKADFDTEQLATLKRNQIVIIEAPVLEIQHENGIVKSVIFNDGSQLNVDAVYAAVPFEQHSTIPQQLGCELTEQGYLKTDNFYKTTVPGVYACGDNTSMMRSVAGAVASGNMAGAMVNMELTKEAF